MTEQVKNTTAKIFYVYDALCGWCYGFSPLIKKIYEEHASDFDFDIISGGMVVDEREGLVKPEMSEYILNAIPRVEEYTGIQFGESHKQQLRKGSLFQSSVKPAIALTLFKSMLPEKAFDFAADMQHRFFYEGNNLQDDQTYISRLEDYPIDATTFLSQLSSDKFKYMAYLEFQQVQEWNVTGFPALIGKKDGQYYWLSKGFQPYAQLKKLVEDFRNI